jgi:methionine salvage enolase-phosphatase E1
MKKWIAGIVAMLALFGCKEAFEPELSQADLRVLTVEGYLDTEGKPSELYLGYTRKIYGENLGPGSTPALGAEIYLQSSSGQRYALSELGNGYYQFQQDLAENDFYHLKISFGAAESYSSAPLRPLISTPIEDVNYEKDERGVEIYVTTRGSREADDFIWTYSETYAYSPKFISPYIYRPESKDVETRLPEETIYHCYRTLESPDLIMETSSNFDENVVFKKPITRISPGDERLSNKYSILVSQMALSPEAAEFWEIMRQNTDDIGTIFSPMPSNITGNITSDQNPKASVIGYVSLGVIQQRRLFIRVQDVSPWNNDLSAYFDCELDADTVSASGYEERFASGEKFPAMAVFVQSSIIGYRSALRRCVDCTLRGTNVRPDFWED